MALAWLEFDYSEDAEGNGSFDAMAAASPAQLAALQAEVARVLDWAHGNFGEPQPPEDGGEWHYELQGVQEVSTPLQVEHTRGRLQMQPGAPGAPRTTLSLTLGGTPTFCAAFRQAFDLA
jgi:hypothetical protein